jgi:putative oxidoreductase
LGLFIVMVLATGFHLSRGEARAIPITLSLAGLAAFVAWGRFRKIPVSAR